MFSFDIRFLSVRSRIITVFLIVILLLSLSIPLMISLQYGLVAHLENITEVEGKSNRMLLKAYAHVNHSRLNLFRYLQDYLPSTWEALDEAEKAENLVRQADILLQKSGRESLLENIQPLFDSFTERIAKVQELAMAGDSSASTRFVFLASKVGVDLGVRIDQIVKSSERHIDTTNSLEREYAKRKLYLYILGYFVVLVCSVILLRYLSKSITLPIAELREGAESFREGTLDELIQESGRDELSLLAKTFNDMARQLKTSFSEIEKHRNQLERLVLERTHEISKTNSKLTLEIQEREKMSMALEAAKEEAEAANQMKTQFLANMSHEIRTPMNGVMGMASLLLQTKLNGEQQNFANTIRTSAFSLINILNDILDFSKIEAGKLDYEHLDFDLRETLEEIVEMVAATTHGKRVNIGCIISPDVCCFLVGDPGRLRQVIINLLTNGVKFTAEGEVTLRVNQLSNSGSSRFLLEFTVADNGIGIAQEKQDRLFKTFSQVDASNTREFGGTGLGLAISKKLARMMGGDIRVTSEIGKGSVFNFTAMFDGQQQRQDEYDSLPPNVAGKRVLVWGKPSIHREMLQFFLENWGCEVTVASNRRHGVSILRERCSGGDCYDLVFMDQEMLVGSDNDSFETNSENQGLRDIPLVLLIHHGEKGNLSNRNKSGFTASLTKPVRRLRLYEVILAAFGHETNEKSNHAGVRAITIEPEFEALKVLMVEDNITNQKVAMYILQKLGCSVDVVYNGQEAVDAYQSIAYNLIIMDIQMPVLDGIGATVEIRKLEKKLREDPAFIQGGRPHRVPIIACTANVMKGDREKYLQVGMDDYIDKPIDAEKFQVIVQKWGKLGVDPNPVEQVIPSDSSSSKVVDSNIVMDLAATLKRTLGNVSFMKSWAQDFINEEENTLSEFELFAQDNDFDAVKHKGHTLKGAALNLGAPLLAQKAFEIESCGRQEDLSELDLLVTQLRDEFSQLRQFLDEVDWQELEQELDAGLQVDAGQNVVEE